MADILPTRVNFEICMSRWLLIAALFAAPALCAQSIPYVPPTSIYTPEIHIGSATEPSTITMSPVVEVPAESVEATASNVQPASTSLLATRHFDYVVSPLDRVTPGSMADTSISLGEYARKLRAQREEAKANRTNTTPDSMARPVR
jgi:hypothetical protein